MLYLMRVFVRWVGVYVRHILEKFDESIRDHGHEMYSLNCPAVKQSLSENARFSQSFCAKGKRISKGNA